MKLLSRDAQHVPAACVTEFWCALGSPGLAGLSHLCPRSPPGAGGSQTHRQDPLPEECPGRAEHLGRDRPGLAVVQRRSPLGGSRESLTDFTARRLHSRGLSAHTPLQPLGQVWPPVSPAPGAAEAPHAQLAPGRCGFPFSPPHQRVSCCSPRLTPCTGRSFVILTSEISQRKTLPYDFPHLWKSRNKQRITGEGRE